MGQEYLEDLVQNIYTKCDMTGFEDLKRGYQSMSKTEYQTQKQRLNLLEQEQKSRIRLHDYEERFAQKKARRDTDEISRMQKKNVLWRGAIRLLGAYLSVRTLQNIVQTGAKLQLLQRSIEGLTGSGQDWEFINQQAYKYGVSLDTVAKGYKNFYSSASMAGFSSGQIQGMFSDVLLGARAIGASTPQIEGALLALEQMMSKGRVSMEELRRQLGNALPGAFEIGAKAMGVTTMQFNEMVKAGISAQEFVPKFIKTFKEQYAKGWTDVEQTVAVAQGRLQVAWQQFTMEFLHGETGKALAEGINALAEMLRTPEFKQFTYFLGQIFKWISKIFTWVIRNHKMVLAFLGTAGLYGLLQKNSILFELFTMNIKHAGEMILWFGKNGIFAFKGLSAGAKALGTAIFRTLLPLFAAEDIILGLGQYFLGWNVRSLLGDFLTSQKGLSEINKDPYGSGNLSLNTISENLKNNPEARKLYNAGLKGDAKAMQKAQEMLLKNYSVSPIDIRRGNYGGGVTADIPSGIVTGKAADIQLDKEENNDYTITMGDIIFNISGAGNPQAVAEAVNIELSNLLIGQMGGVTE